MRSPERAFIVVTHYQRLLNYIVPDYVHVLSEGRIVRSGGRELALELEEKGYAGYRPPRERGSDGDARAGPAWVKERREQASRRFAEVGLPDHAAGRLALHEHRADRGREVCARAGRVRAGARRSIASVKVPGAVRLAIVNGRVRRRRCRI